jgi:delta-aminolevulinic acid dehydratase/porphobilinogen synthase
MSDATGKATKEQNKNMKDTIEIITNGKVEKIIICPICRAEYRDYGQCIRCRCGARLGQCDE